MSKVKVNTFCSILNLKVYTHGYVLVPSVCALKQYHRTNLISFLFQFVSVLILFRSKFPGVFRLEYCGQPVSVDRVSLSLYVVVHGLFRLDTLAKALSVIATATWLAGWLSHSGIVSKPLNLSENFFDHLKAPSL